MQWEPISLPPTIPDVLHPRLRLHATSLVLRGTNSAGGNTNATAPITTHSTLEIHEIATHPHFTLSLPKAASLTLYLNAAAPILSISLPS